MSVPHKTSYQEKYLKYKNKYISLKNEYQAIQQRKAMTGGGQKAKSQSLSEINNLTQTPTQMQAYGRQLNLNKEMYQGIENETNNLFLSNNKITNPHISHKGGSKQSSDSVSHAIFTSTAKKASSYSANSSASSSANSSANSSASSSASSASKSASSSLSSLSASASSASKKNLTNRLETESLDISSIDISS